MYVQQDFQWLPRSYLQNAACMPLRAGTLPADQQCGCLRSYLRMHDSTVMPAAWDTYCHVLRSSMLLYPRVRPETP